MIGTSALLINLAFILFPLVIGWAVYREWRSDKSRRNLVGLVFIALFFLVFSNRFFHNLSYYLELRSMSVENVSRIEANGKVFSNPDELAILTDGFNDAQWFSYNHGGVAQPVPVIVYYKSGEQRKYAVRFYQRGEGAVVEFSHRFQNGASVSYGEAFCRRLPKAFENVGSPLPKN